MVGQVDKKQVYVMEKDFGGLNLYYGLKNCLLKHLLYGKIALKSHNTIFA
jgi:hypothetical protein